MQVFFSPFSLSFFVFFRFVKQEQKKKELGKRKRRINKNKKEGNENKKEGS
jgi:hypothetical protein